MTSTGAARGRPRLPETDRRIIDAALALLRDHGPDALSVEAVATASGVARSTVYRRYRDRRAIVDAAMDALAQGPLPAHDLPVEAKLRRVVEEVADLVEDGAGRGVVAAVLTGTDPDVTDALRARLRDRVDALVSLMDEALAAGSLAPGVDPDALAGLLLGAYLGEVLRHGDARPGWADGVVGLLVRAVGAAP